MRITRIQLRNFRNYSAQEFEFSPSGALVLGANGTGKTNLFEAIAYCSLGKSIRYQSDEQLLLFDTPRFEITADFELLSGATAITLSYTPGRKTVTINGVQVKQLSQLFSYIKAVYCSPEDIYLINGSPGQRRQYTDLAIAQLSPVYISELRHYLHIVEQRNAILKDPSQRSQKLQWDAQFIPAALSVASYRLQYADKLNAVIAQKYAHILKEASQLSITYKPSFPLQGEGYDYQQELSNIESREWQYQRTLLGPHLDDYIITFDGKAVKDIGSQGQKRTVALLLKMAQLELIRKEIEDYPILLLDDIFAELDARHTQGFMDILREHGQVFIASPNELAARHWQELPILRLDEEISQ